MEDSPALIPVTVVLFPRPSPSCSAAQEQPLPWEIAGPCSRPRSRPPCAAVCRPPSSPLSSSPSPGPSAPPPRILKRPPQRPRPPLPHPPPLHPPPRPTPPPPPSPAPQPPSMIPSLRATITHSAATCRFYHRMRQRVLGSSRAQRASTLPSTAATAIKRPTTSGASPFTPIASAPPGTSRTSTRLLTRRACSTPATARAATTP